MCWDIASFELIFTDRGVSRLHCVLLLGYVWSWCWLQCPLWSWLLERMCGSDINSLIVFQKCNIDSLVLKRAVTLWLRTFSLCVHLQKFNLFLKRPDDPPLQIEKILAKLDSYLRETGNTFLIGDRLARADCYLLPTIQHVRVAGKVCHYPVRE